MFPVALDAVIYYHVKKTLNSPLKVFLIHVTQEYTLYYASD